MVRLVDRADASARARAAIGFAGLTYKTLESKTKISQSRIQHIARPRPDDSAPTLPELFRLADACGVPRNFMFNGWKRLLGTEEEILQRIELGPDPAVPVDIGAQLMEKMFSQPGETDVDPPDPELRHELEEESPSEEDDAQSDEGEDHPAEGGGA